MKSILQSIKPQYCELIAKGKKTIEVRKTRPKLDVPFKVYIYCTKGNTHLLLPTYSQGELTDSDIWQIGNEKVIGEYVCDEIIEYETEFHPSNDLFQGIWKTVYDEDIEDTINFIETSNDYDNPNDCDMCRKSCLSFDDIRNYVGYGNRKFYGWHISDLKIYDKPKELYDFIKPCTDPYQYCQGCKHGHINYPSDVETYEDLSGCFFDTVCLNRIRKAPLSWCYVEEV